MTPPARAYIRLCSSLLAPILFVVLLWSQGTLRTAAHLPAAREGVLPAIPHELPDGVHLAIAKPKATPRPRARPAQAVRHVGIIPIPQELPQVGGSVFSGFGAWVDVYDYPLLPLSSTIATLKAAGVQTLYMETGWSDQRYIVDPLSVPWLLAAHRAGMKVVAWYLPHYVNVANDVMRTVYTARKTFQGQRFDGIGVDIEFKGAQPRNRIWNANVVTHMRSVRAALGPEYPLAAIPPPPLQMRLAPSMWGGFPWAQLGQVSSEIMLMSYWSFRSGCPHIRVNCAYEFTRYNVEITRTITGGRVPIHVIGGVGDGINTQQVHDFVRGAIDAHADGASIYDIGTTQPWWWGPLSQLRALRS